MHPSRPHLLVFGLGYSGTEVARQALAAGWAVTGTHRGPLPPAPPDPAPALSPSGSPGAPPTLPGAPTAHPGTPSTGPGAAPVPSAPGLAVVAFDDAGPALATATHVLATAAPTDSDPGHPGDPVLARHAAAIAAAPRLRWVGYLSTTGVYGDRGGAWVDEATAPAPRSARSRRRLEAEQAWRDLAGDRLDLFRLAGIYGPGRSPFAELRAGRARRVRKPGHAFGRIHRHDIAAAVLAAMVQDVPGCGIRRPRVLNLSDDEPAESADVIAEAARLLGLDPPPESPFATAMTTMSPMALSFWAEDRKVSSAATQRALGLRWRYPSYREGLAASLREEG